MENVLKNCSKSAAGNKLKGFIQMKKLNLGIVGCGVIGNMHAQVAANSDIIRLVAVADLDKAKAEKTAVENKAERFYDDPEKLFKDTEIDAVVLALPAGIRGKAALSALKHGKHILLEKPAAMNMTELKKIIKASKGLICGSCSGRFRTTESSRFVTEFIADGNLGEIRHVRCRCVSPAGEAPRTPQPAWRVSKAMNGGGFLVNWGIYDMDYLLGITGWKLRPEFVLSKTWEIPPPFNNYVPGGSDAEEHVAAMVLCSNGAVFSIERGERVTTSLENTWEIIGSKGSLHIQMLNVKDKKIIFHNASSEKGVSDKVIWEGDESQPGNMLHAGILEDFARAVLEKRKPLTGIDEALILQEFVDAIYKSAGTGKAVSLKK
jgi:predicted dehydrogenase